MGGEDDTFFALGASALFLASLWYGGRVFQAADVSPILAYIIVGATLGPEGLDIVPFSHCFNDAPTLENYNFPEEDVKLLNESGVVNVTTPENHLIHSINVWNIAGQLGVTFLIMESGMHLHIDKLRSVGASFITVAVLGTLFPIVLSVIVFGLLLDYPMFPDAFAAGVALTPTSVGIAVALLSELKKLETDAGQTIVAAAFVDDVLSLVLLVILLNLAASSITAVSIIVPIVSSISFVVLGGALGHFVMPAVLPYLLMERIPDKARASIQPRDQVHITIMMLFLALFSYLGHLIGSHLLGAFVAGLCFVQVPRSTRVIQTQFKRIVSWFIRLFFGATVAFSIPLNDLFNVTAFWHGIVAFVVVGVIGKLTSALQLGKDKWVVGWAMVARGEFGLLVAETALRTPLLTGEEGAPAANMITGQLYAAILWAILLAIVLTPFAFRIVLKRRYKHDGEDGYSMLRVSVQGHHHAGALHEVSSVLHQFGLDISSATVETDGIVDKETFDAVVRGHRKADRLSNDNVAEMRKMLEEVMLDKAEVLVFPCSDDEMQKSKDDMCNSAKGDDMWMEIDIVGDHSDSTLNDVVELLNSFGLDVVRADTKAHEGKDIVNLYARDLSKKTKPLDRQQVRNEVHNVFKKNGISGQVMVKVLHGNCTYESKRYTDLHSFSSELDDGLMELRIKGEHVPGLLKAISGALFASHLQVLGAEVVKDGNLEVISFFVKDDDQISQGMKLVAQSTTDALKAVRMRSDSTSSRRSRSSSFAKAKTAQFLVAPRRFAADEIDLEAGGYSKQSEKKIEKEKNEHREKHNEAALFHVPFKKYSRSDSSDGEVGEANPVEHENRTLAHASSFSMDSFVALRRNAVKAVVEQICESYDATCTVTLRTVNQAFMGEEPDSTRRATILGEINTGASGTLVGTPDSAESQPAAPNHSGSNTSKSAPESPGGQSAVSERSTFGSYGSEVESITDAEQTNASDAEQNNGSGAGLTNASGAGDAKVDEAKVDEAKVAKV